MKILSDILLAPYTTFGIGGPARWFVEAATEDEVVEAIAWARERRRRLFVLGGGSNLLVSDAGFDGLVLRVAVKGIEQDGERLRCAAGEDWERCVQRAVEADLAGIECLAGIPGTAGGTPVQNVGAYGQEVASTVELVRAFDLEQRALVELRNGECGFAYRRSRFNSSDRGQFVVTRVDYRLKHGARPQLAYADLKTHFASQTQSPTLAEVANAVREIRKRKGMLLVEDDPNCRSAGSFFKNPTVEPEVAARVREAAVRAGVPLRTFPTDGGLMKIPAAWLIEQAGFSRGYMLGGAGISEKHTLALVNCGGARADEVMALAERIMAAVDKQFGVRLEMEPVCVGF